MEFNSSKIMYSPQFKMGRIKTSATFQQQTSLQQISHCLQHATILSWMVACCKQCEICCNEVCC